MDDSLRANVRLIGFGFLLAFCSSVGQTFFISMYADQIRAEYALSHAGFGAYYSVATLLSAGVLLWTGPQVDRRELRLMTTTVIAGLACGALLLAYTRVGALLFVGLFLLRHCGQGLLSHVAASSTARYFDKRRGRALSLVIAGHAVGEAFLPAAAVAVFSLVYWRTSWALVSAVLALVVIPAVWVLLRDHGQRHKDYLDTLSANEESGQVESRIRQWTRREVLRDRAFYFVMVALLAPAFIGTGFLFHQVHVAAEKGWSLSWLAASYMGYAGLSVAASLVTGVVIDRVGALRVLPWFLAPLGVSVLVLATSSSQFATWAYMGSMGICLGMVLPMMAALWAEAYGVKNIGAIRSMSTACAVFASAGSPVVFGFLIDAGFSIAALAGMSLVAIVVANVMAVIASRLYLLRRSVAPR
jgi:MFS family permease